MTSEPSGAVDGTPRHLPLPQPTPAILPLFAASVPPHQSLPCLAKPSLGHKIKKKRGKKTIAGTRDGAAACMRAGRRKGCTDTRSSVCVCVCVLCVRTHIPNALGPSRRHVSRPLPAPHLPLIPDSFLRGLLSLTETNVDTWHRGTCSQLTRCLIKVIYWFIYGRLEAAV